MQNWHKFSLIYYFEVKYLENIALVFHIQFAGSSPHHSNWYPVHLRGLSTIGLHFVHGKKTFKISCLLSCIPSTQWIGVYPKRKEFSPIESKFLPFRIDPFDGGEWAILTVTTPSSISNLLIRSNAVLKQKKNKKKKKKHQDKDRGETGPEIIKHFSCST